MYPHHEEAICNLKTMLEKDPGVIGAVLGGSIAKGLERPDSDVDAIVVVTPEKYRRLQEERRTSECIFEGCNYPNGYYDLKYYRKDHLQAAADHGSEPTRYAYTNSRCIFAKDSDLPELVKRIPVFQKAEKEEKMLSFYAALRLYGGYFWKSSRDNLYLRVRSAASVVLFGMRLLLEDAEVLFPCQKNLMIAVSALPPERRPADIVQRSESLLRTLDDAEEKAFIASILECIRWNPPQDYTEVCSRFIRDHEEWWYETRPFIEEW